MTYSIRGVSRTEANLFFETSPSATAFHNPSTLEILSPGTEWLGIQKGHELCLIWPYNPLKNNSVLPPFSFHYGPYWSSSILSQLPSSVHQEQQRVVKLLLEYFRDRDEEFVIELCPDDLDVRGYQWWNFDGNHPHVHITPRYTARISDLQTKTEDRILSGMRAVRRRDIKKIQASARFDAVNTVEPEFALETYLETLRRSAGTVSEDTLRTLHRLLNSAVGEAFQTIGLFDKEVGKMAGFCLLLHGKSVSNLVVLATASDYRDFAVGPRLVYDAILLAKKRGNDAFDFNGANSPHRGDDKHSYGALPLVFFRLSGK